MVFPARGTRPLGICLPLFGIFRRLFLSLGRSHWSQCHLPLALSSQPSLALASPSTCRLGEGPEHRLKPPEITMLGGGLSGPCYPRRRPRGPTLSVSWCFYARPKSGLESPAFHPNPPNLRLAVSNLASVSGCLSGPSSLSLLSLFCPPRTGGSATSCQLVMCSIAAVAPVAKEVENVVLSSWQLVPHPSFQDVSDCVGEPLSRC